MTLKEFAERLNGAEYNGYPVFSKEDIGIAKENGFVIVTGTSDDLMEFEGAIEDEAGCFNGGKVYFSKNGVEEDKTQNAPERPAAPGRDFMREHHENCHHHRRLARHRGRGRARVLRPRRPGRLSL